MGCDNPLKGYRTPHGSDSKLTFNPMRALNSANPISVPCGQCTGCRLERSRQWAVRMTHESQLYAHNCFITLTYDDEHLPADYSIHLRHWQLFMKRLREDLPQKIRFYACGEYGEQSLRPHYHAIIFNHDFYPKTIWSKNKRGNSIYTSPSLTKLWPYGLATLGTVTPQSTSYVARYAMKKITGPPADDHYARVHPLTKKVHYVHPEFAVMSRRPGLGAGWLDKFRTDLYPDDFVITDGHKARPPKYYEKILTEEELNELKRRRKRGALRYKADQTPERKKVRAAVRDARITNLKRGLS